jgi:hypothetical protein
MRSTLLLISLLFTLFLSGCISSNKSFVDRQVIQGKWILTNEAASDKIYFAPAEQSIMILNDDNSCIMEYRAKRLKATYQLNGNNLRIFFSSDSQERFDILLIKDGKMEVISSGNGFAFRNAKYLLWEKLE